MKQSNSSIMHFMVMALLSLLIISCQQATNPELTPINTDRDNDSVLNDADICPDLTGDPMNQGCPESIILSDQDSDRVGDVYDVCPGVYGLPSNNGCPIVTTPVDTDNDGIVDVNDQCPNEMGSLANSGCPDEQGFTASALTGQQLYDDSVLNCAGCHDLNGVRGSKIFGSDDSDIIGLDGVFKCELTTCEDLELLANYIEQKMPIANESACAADCAAHIALFIQTFSAGQAADSDNDGVVDLLDVCPNEAGDINYNGCPAPVDSDQDGFADSIDQCPNEFGVVENNGCPAVVIDSDNDGVTDLVDACPNEVGVADNNGCPADVTPQDSDNDGIVDSLDQCPNEIGTAENNGCPGKRDMNEIEQAGETLYKNMCVSCHDEKGDGGRANLIPSIKDSTFIPITDLSMPEPPLDPSSCETLCAEKIEAYLRYINDLFETIVSPPTTDPEEVEPVVHLAINAGSASGYTTKDGTIKFSKDEYFTGGTGNDNALRDIASTQDDLLFSSERWGEFQYAIAVPNGEYEVEFWLSELYHENEGDRSFSINVEGQATLSNFDVLKTTGSKDKAYISVRFKTNVSDGELNLDFISAVENPTVSGFVIYRQPYISEKYLENCQGCHGNEQGEKVTFGGALVKSSCDICESKENLATYISVKMPFEYASTCVDECAQQYADYIYDNFAGFQGRPSVIIDEPVEISGDENACNDGVDASFTGLIRISNEQFQNSLRDVFLVSDDYVSGFTIDEKIGNFSVNSKKVITEIEIEQYLESMQVLSVDAIANMNSWINCSEKNDACADKIIDEIGMKLFRRALTNTEKSNLKEVYTQAKSNFDNQFVEGAQYLLQAMLASPHFLYQLEVDLTTSIGNNIVKLNQYEIAARLASFIWRSVPDTQLLQAATNNELSNKAQIKAQAQRMLQDEKAEFTISSFHIQWMGVEALDESDGHYNEKVAGIGDVSRTVIELVQTDGSMQDLYSVDFAYLNDDAKSLYGVTTNPTQTNNDGFDRYELSDEKRQGILTRGAFLSANHNTAHRGKFVRQQVLCGVIPPAPAGVNTDLPETSGLSPREIWDQHVEKPSCGGCHKLMDPIGFGFDHYDEVGHWQEQAVNPADGMLWDIDTSGELFATTDINETFMGANELQSLLARSVDTKACYSYQWFAYANGRTPKSSDACSLAQSIQISTQAGGSIQDIIIAITQTDAFSHRRTQSN